MAIRVKKQYKNLKELNRSQLKIKKVCNEYEIGFLNGIINPQSLLINFASSLLFNRKKNNYRQASLKSPVNAMGSSVVSFIKRPKVKSIAGDILKSLVRWQIFNISFYLGKKLFKSIKFRLKK